MNFHSRKLPRTSRWREVCYTCCPTLSSAGIPLSRLGCPISDEPRSVIWACNQSFHMSVAGHASSRENHEPSDCHMPLYYCPTPAAPLLLLPLYYSTTAPLVIAPLLPLYTAVYYGPSTTAPLLPLFYSNVHYRGAAPSRSLSNTCQNVMDQGGCQLISCSIEIGWREPWQMRSRRRFMRSLTTPLHSVRASWQHRYCGVESLLCAVESHVMSLMARLDCA